MVLQLTDLNGRTGNNIYQIINLIFISRKLEDYFIISVLFTNSERIRNILDFKKINKKFNIYPAKPKVYKDPFYHISKIFDFEPSNPKPLFFDIAKELRDCLKFEIKEYDENDHLYIHIRSGDTFTTIEPKYIQPPFNYYRKIIEDNPRYKKITIITEKDNFNPVVKEISKTFKDTHKVNIERNSKEEDFRKLVGVKNLVIANSTFSVVAVYMNKTIKNLYLFEGVISDKDPYRFHMLFKNEIPDSINVHVYQVKDYFVEQKYDGTKKEVRRKLIDHPIEKIIKI